MGDMSEKKNNSVLDERQTYERQRLGFHCFMITCVELCAVLVASMFCYDWINEKISFFAVLMFCLIIPVLYFNIRTKISGVTNPTECIFSVILAFLYLILLVISIFTHNVSFFTVVFGVLFIINGVIGAVYIKADSKAAKEDYDEVHGSKTNKD